MKETKKVILEEGDKRMTMEQGIEDEISKTPQWDSLKVNMKEGFAEKFTVFGGSFMGALAPAFLIMTVLIIIVGIIVWGC